MKKNICLVLTNLKSGGLQRNASILANHFNDCGHKVFICCLYSTECFFDINSNIEIIDCKSNKSKYFSTRYWKKILHNLFIDKKIDSVISFGERCGIVAAKACKGLNVNHICRGVNTRKNTLNRMMINNNLNNISKFVFQTNAQKDLYNAKIQNKGVIISNPFNVQSSNLNIKGIDSKRFITVASFKLKQKRQDLMIEAFSEFIKSHSDYIFEFYGECDQESRQYIKSIIKKHNLNDNVKLMGESNNIKEAIVPSRAFICASTYEGMPNALIEAMSYGIPVISSKWAGFDEIFKENENSLLFEINDLGGLIKCMNLIAENDVFSNIIDNSWKYVKSHFNKEDVLKKWDEII